MRFRQFDTAVLQADMPEHGLKAGDVGTVVEVYGEDGVEVEFVLPSGDTLALLTLGTDAVRPLDEHDVFAVRPALESTS
jgi:hypothetical protein